MARHRSPQGRRTHLGLPLPPLVAAAGAGAHALRSPDSTTLIPRVVATVVAGSALAAAGQAALTHGLPTAPAGNVLRLGVHELLGTPVVSTADPDPRPVDVAGLAKAVDRYAAAARPAVPTPAAVPDAAAAPTPAATPTLRPVPRAARPEAPRVPAHRPPPHIRPPAHAEPDPAPPAGDVQMIIGRVTSGFGIRWGRPHLGLDVAAPIGTPIRVPLAGEVVASGPATGFGLWVRVRHDDGTVTTYGHVNRTLVRVGEHVAAGQEIAEVGNRGDSTGPHLHVEVQTPAGATVDPRPWLDGHGIGY